MFSRFDSIPACDRQTHTQTDRQTGRWLASIVRVKMHYATHKKEQYKAASYKLTGAAEATVGLHPVNAIR